MYKNGWGCFREVFYLRRNLKLLIRISFNFQKELNNNEIMNTHLLLELVMWADEAPFSCTTARSHRAAISVKADDADSSDSGSSFDRLFTPLDLNGEDYKSVSIKLDLLAGRAGREFFFSSESDLRSAGASAKDFSLDESSFDLIAVAEFLVRQEILVDSSEVTHRGNVDVLLRENFRLKILLDSWNSSLISVYKTSLILSCIFT